MAENKHLDKKSEYRKQETDKLETVYFDIDYAEEILWDQDGSTVDYDILDLPSQLLKELIDLGRTGDTMYSGWVLDGVALSDEQIRSYYEREEDLAERLQLALIDRKKGREGKEPVVKIQRAETGYVPVAEWLKLPAEDRLRSRKWGLFARVHGDVNDN